MLLHRTAQWLDRAGWFVALLVGLCNYESFRIAKAKEEDAHGVKEDPASKTNTPTSGTESSLSAVAGDV